MFSNGSLTNPFGYVTVPRHVGHFDAAIHTKDDKQVLAVHFRSLWLVSILHGSTQFHQPGEKTPETRSNKENSENSMYKLQTTFLYVFLG